MHRYNVYGTDGIAINEFERLEEGGCGGVCMKRLGSTEYVFLAYARCTAFYPGNGTPLPIRVTIPS